MAFMTRLLPALLLLGLAATLAAGAPAGAARNHAARQPGAAAKEQMALLLTALKQKPTVRTAGAPPAPGVARASQQDDRKVRMAMLISALERRPSSPRRGVAGDGSVQIAHLLTGMKRRAAAHKAPAVARDAHEGSVQIAQLLAGVKRGGAAAPNAPAVAAARVRALRSHLKMRSLQRHRDVDAQRRDIKHMFKMVAAAKKAREAAQ